ncbi:hypothetical protein RHMOL_Rhmol13G0016900 [Rhododendron molle]|uniref:Uncharacterized protein n=1 Tax=Rhododendron molle TaxID=49168 RepID=A0ACC0L3E3_RHOML|nr:hypothetical protein RHMOL_Rhmol13G0016900 [Rhododendron molle]
MIGGTADVAAVQGKETKLVQVLDVYEVRLAQSKYLGGDDFTLVDLHHLPCIHRLMGSQVEKLFDSWPMSAHGAPISWLGRLGLSLDGDNEGPRSRIHNRIPESVRVPLRERARLRPFGQVPAFEDGDMTLFESRAINLYIAHAYEDKGTQLIYHGKKMAILSMWMQVEANQFDPVASKLVWELVIKLIFGMTTDTAVVEVQEAKLGQVLDIYEVRLGQSKYLGGDDFTLVDLHHLPNIQYLMGTQVKKLFDSRPHVNAWCADILARPAWLKVLAMQHNN